MSSLFKNKKLIAVSLFSLAALGSACNSANTTVNTNAPANVANSGTTANANTNANAVTNGETVVIEAREPERYQVNVNLQFQTGGADKTMTLPTISALVAKNGNDRRMEFTLPNTNEKIVYLNAGGRHFAIFPQRKQYAELNKDSTGFEMGRMLTPEELVSRVKAIKGLRLAGEEQVNGRTVLKYTYGATTDTKSQAGNVETQSVILIDKETGLPLRTETVSQATGSSVQGVDTVRAVTEVTNLNTAVDQASFAEPTDFKKVAPEEIRQQVNLIFGTVAILLNQMMQRSGNPPAVNQPMNSQSTNNQPMSVSPSPTATARP